MQIQGLGHIHGPQQISAPHITHGTANQGTGAPQSPAVRDSINVDQLDISPEADMVSRTRDIPDIRHERVDSIRQQIAAGTYDSSEKLEIALSRLLDELA